MPSERRNGEDRRKHQVDSPLTNPRVSEQWSEEDRQQRREHVGVAVEQLEHDFREREPLTANEHIFPDSWLTNQRASELVEHVATMPILGGPPDTFTQSFDAQPWAKAFMARFSGKSIAVENAAGPALIARAGDVDEGTMIGWFASALMRGYEEGHANGVAERNLVVHILEQAGQDLQAKYATSVHTIDQAMEVLRRAAKDLATVFADAASDVPSTRESLGILRPERSGRPMSERARAAPPV